MEYIIKAQRGGSQYWAADVFGGLWVRDIENAYRFASKQVAQSRLEQQFQARPNAVLIESPSKGDEHAKT